MATSPSEELRIVTITEFTRSPTDGDWYWTTKAANGVTVGDGGEGYKELRKAIAGFFAQQGFDPEVAAQHYSQPIKVTNREYHIHKYAPDDDQI
jgi:hypothetical protein